MAQVLERTPEGVSQNAALPFSFSSYQTSPVSNPKPVLKIGCSLGALFDLRGGMKGSSSYLFAPGPAFALIAKHLQLNAPGDLVAEITILTKLSPSSSRRVAASMGARNLNLGIASLREVGLNALSGACSYASYLREDRQMDLILTTLSEDVRKAVGYGIPAVYVDPDHIPQGQETDALRVAFDFDRCAALACAPVEKAHRLAETLTPDAAACDLDNEAYTRKHGQFFADQRELALADIPAYPGPIAPYAIKFCALRDTFKNDPKRPDLFFDIVTARSHGCLPRVATTLAAFRCAPDALISTAYESKGDQVAALRSDAFFDDGEHHVKDVRAKSPRTMSGQVVYNDRFVRQALTPYTL